MKQTVKKIISSVVTIAFIVSMLGSISYAESDFTAADAAASAYNIIQTYYENPFDLYPDNTKNPGYQKFVSVPASGLSIENVDENNVLKIAGNIATQSQLTFWVNGLNTDKSLFTFDLTVNQDAGSSNGMTFYVTSRGDTWAYPNASAQWLCANKNGSLSAFGTDLGVKWVKGEKISVEVYLEPNTTTTSAGKVAVSVRGNMTHADGTPTDYATMSKTYSVPTGSWNQIVSRVDVSNGSEQNSIYIDNYKVCKVDGYEAPKPEATPTPTPTPVETVYFNDDCSKTSPAISSGATTNWQFNLAGGEYVSVVDPEDDTNKVYQMSSFGTTKVNLKKAIVNGGENIIWKNKFQVVSKDTYIGDETVKMLFYTPKNADELAVLKYSSEMSETYEKPVYEIEIGGETAGYALTDKYIEFKADMKSEITDLTDAVTEITLSGSGLLSTSGEATGKIVKTIETPVDDTAAFTGKVSSAAPAFLINMTGGTAESKNTVLLDYFKIIYLEMPKTGLPITISTSDNLEQKTGSVEEITFTVSADGEIEKPEKIVWYINGEATKYTGMTFCYTPEDRSGTTVVYAVNNEAEQSNICMVKVRSETGKFNLDPKTNRIVVNDFLKWPENVGEGNVAMWKNNAMGAFTNTADDGILGDFPTWKRFYDEYGIPTTLFVPGGKTLSNVSKWKEYNDMDGISIQSHTYSHPDKTKLAAMTDDEFMIDYSRAVQAIENVIGERNIVSAYSNGVAGNVDIARQFHIAARGTYGVPNKGSSINYNDVNSKSGVGTVLYKNGTTSNGQNSSFEAYIKSMYDENYKVWGETNFGGWVSMHSHQICGSKKASSELSEIYKIYNPDVSDDELSAMTFNEADKAELAFKHILKPAIDEGKIWAGLFYEVAMYGQERDTSKLTVTQNADNIIKYTLTDEMDDTIFTYPLTVKFRVDETWTDIKASIAGSSEALPVKELVEDGKKYVLVDTVPDCGEVWIIPSNMEQPVFSDNAKLSSLTYTAAAQADVDNFSADDEGGEYNVELEANTVSVTVNAQKADSKSSITIPDNGIVDVSSGYGSITIVVKAESGNTNTFKINFTVKKEEINDPSVKVVFADDFNSYETLSDLDENSSWKAGTVSDNETSYAVAVKDFDFTETKFNSDVYELVSDGMNKYLRIKAGNRAGAAFVLPKGEGIGEYTIEFRYMRPKTEGSFSFRTLTNNGAYTPLIQENVPYSKASKIMYNVVGFNASRAWDTPKGKDDGFVGSSGAKAEKWRTVKIVYTASKDERGTFLYYLDGQQMVFNDREVWSALADVFDLKAFLFASHEITATEVGTLDPIELNIDDIKVTRKVKKERSTLSVSSNNGKILSSVNGGPQEDWGSVHSGEFDRDSEFRFTAVGSGSNKFMYWKDVNSNSIISYDTDCTVSLGSGKNITAVFADGDNGAYITFKNSMGKIYRVDYNEVTVPQNPYMMGYTFAGWFKDGEKIKQNTGEVFKSGEDVEIIAGWVLDNTDYTVTVSGAKETGGKYKYNEKVTLNADENEETFVYWMRDGKIVSYDKIYSFYIFADTNISAVYSSSDVQKESIIAMHEPFMVGTDKIAFYAERNIADGMTVIENGILLDTKSGIDLENYTHKVVSSKTSNAGQFTVRKANVSTGDTWYGRAYVIYKDTSGNVYTIYSDEVSKTV